jgi:hypothetical protein
MPILYLNTSKEEDVSDYSFTRHGDDDESYTINVYSQLDKEGDTEWVAIAYDSDENEVDRTRFSKKPTHEDVNDVFYLW